MCQSFFMGKVGTSMPVGEEKVYQRSNRKALNALGGEKVVER
jgi:hypothetical protein